MPPVRYTDDSDNVWVLDEHESAVASVILAIPTIEFSRELYALYDLTAELWAYEIQKGLLELDCALPVHAYSTPDVVGAIVEVGTCDRSWLIKILRQVSYRPPAGLTTLGKIRDAAVARVYRASSEASALAIWSRPGHRYSVSIEERVLAIQRSDFSASQRIIDEHSKIFIAVGGGLEKPEGVRLLTPHSSRMSKEYVQLPAEDTVNIAHSHSAALAQVAIVTPGVLMSSSQKADFHIFWTLMREREGVFYRLTRSRGGLIYSIAAFNREYHEGGFGMCVVSCAPTQVPSVVQSAKEAVAYISGGETSPSLLDDAAELVGIGRSLAMRNPLAVAKALLASELSLVAPDDYSAQLAMVSHRSVAATAQRTVHEPGWRIRVTLPGNPE